MMPLLRRFARLLALTCLLLPSLALRAADKPAPATHADEQAEAGERTAKARLLGVRRLTPPKNEGGPVDGLSFAVLVIPTREAHDRALKEPKDFLLKGESYHSRTQSALGKKFAPRTELHDAEEFFAKAPALAAANKDVPKGSFVMTISIVGAELDTGEEVSLPLSVGFLKKPASLLLRTKVPPGR